MTPAALVAAALLFATPPPPSTSVSPPPPPDTECLALPQPHSPFSFGAGEDLEFDLDALGLRAGKLYLRVLPPDKDKGAALPIQAEVKNSTFFAKIRKVSGGGTSYLHPKTLRPTRYIEDIMEDDIHRWADVVFKPKEHTAALQSKENDNAQASELRFGNEALDLVGSIYLLRQLSLNVGMPLCFDAYGVRKVWRVFGKVITREHVSLPIGEFEAFHISGMAVRLDNPNLPKNRREIHLWISDDAKRLPLVTMGVIDIGAIRATLTAITRPDTRKRAQGKESLTW